MRYFLGLLAVVAFIILVVVIVTHGGPKTATTKTPQGNKAVVLTDYIDKKSEVHLYTDGQLNAQENHRAVEIIVSKDSRSLTIYKGYNLEVLRQETYPNTAAAYDNLLRALSLASFVKERADVKRTDERGTCPAGRRFIYELRENGQTVTRLWTTSCGSVPGTYAGAPVTTRSLFQRQIPNYNKFLQGIAL